MYKPAECTVNRARQVECMRVCVYR